MIVVICKYCGESREFALTMSARAAFLCGVCGRYTGVQIGEPPVKKVKKKRDQ